MEYNYTRELKQPHKIYTFKGYPIPLFPDGVRAEYLVVFGLVLFLVLVVGAIAVVFKLDIITYFFLHDYLLVILGVGLIVWILFTLKWDRKNFFEFLFGRVSYRLKRGKAFEHQATAPLVKGNYQYRVFNQKRSF